MKTKGKFGVVGFNGKIGSQLVKLGADFIPVECDVTNAQTIYQAKAWNGYFDVIINCAAISTLEGCAGKNYPRALAVNVQGLTNLHTVFGKRVLTISSEAVFPNQLFAPKETATRAPVSDYGMTKLGAEVVSQAMGGKVLRLSRAVSVYDHDISHYLREVVAGRIVQVPVFMLRSYVTQSMAAKAIAVFARNFDAMPSVLHFGGERVSYYKLIKHLVGALGMDSSLVKPRYWNDKSKIARTYLAGLNTDKAKSVYHIPSLAEVVEGLKEEFFRNA